MSLWNRLLGRRSFEDERADGDRLFGEGAFPDARLAYQRALDRGQGAAEEGLEHCRTRIAACLDRMAEASIAEAERLIEAGHDDLAAQELVNAMETAASEEVGTVARSRLEALEGRDARRVQAEAEELSDDDRWTILAGSFSDDQLDELDGYGEAARAALLAVHDERFAEGRATLEALLEEAEAPRYLWLELGRARLLDGDAAGAEEALRAFVAAIPEDEGGAPRVRAHTHLADLAEERGDEATAIDELQRAVDALPEDARPYLNLGRYLREKGHGDDAVEVLRAAKELGGGDRAPWPVLAELGLAELESGHATEARGHLLEVMQTHIQQRQLDFPAEAAAGLATLHEKAGELEQAAALWKSLARGSHRAGHLRYHREAGRVLAALGEREEARRMLSRALALAEDDEEVKALVEAELRDLA
ncbi:MAG: hypothetical protein ACFCGT_06730 [Sandaracinaceae bacterium]